jgi:voltage-gated potassium channel Kch
MHAAPRTGVWTRALRVIATVDWWVVVTAIVVVAVAAYRGIFAYCDPARPWAPPPLCEPAPTRSDAAYLTLQLFLWQSGGQFLGPRVVTALDVARFLAPLLAGYAAVRALLALFATQVQLLAARFARDHVIVCGLGPQGLAVARNLRAVGWRVVMLELEDARPGTTAAQAIGAVIVGDATDPATLRRAGLAGARHLVAVCGDDAINAEVVAAAAAIAAGGRRVLTCHAHVATPALWERLRPRELASTREGASRLQFFSAVDLTARAVVAEALPAADHPAPHLVLAGHGAVAERVVVRAALAWHAVAGAARLRLTLAGTAAGAHVAAIRDVHPRLSDVCDVVGLEFDAAAPGAAQRLLALLEPHPPVSTACLSGLDDAALLAWALGVIHATPDHAFDVVVIAAREQGLDLLAGADAGTGTRLAVVGALERGCSVEAVFGGTHELLARAIHGEYVRAQAAAGHTVAANPSLQPWSALPEILRESNRRQADDIAAKIASIGARLVPQSEWDAPAFAFTADEVERLAELEHMRWVNERQQAHWSYDRRKAVDQARSPHLKPWADLTPDVKDIDRNTVRHIPQFLARIGLGIRRHVRDGAADSSLRS